MNRLVLLLLLDACRSDYLKRTDYLQSLSRQSYVGCLKEPFGFLPRSAYFGGLNPEETGFTNIYCYDPANSPFGLARGIHLPPTSSNVEFLQEARKKIRESARQRTTRFAASYLSTLDIPIPFLPYFDLAEKFAPWEKDAGYYSLFDVLRENRLPWYQCSWPLSNLLPRQDDAAIIGETLRGLQPEHRFAFVHLGGLDSVGHQYGPGSSEIQTSLHRTDRLVKALVEHCQSVYNDFSLIAFGDHGMVNVIRTLDLWELLQQTGLHFGKDYAYFLDSTMARFWFHTNRSRKVITEMLSRIQEGAILDESVRRQYSISGCDPRNGELIFLVKPGVVIHPSFFQMSGAPVKGMHGYAPEVKDNQGVFLIHNAGGKGNLGILEAKQIFPTCLSLLGFESKRFTAIPSALDSCDSGRSTSKYTIGAVDVDTVIQNHLDLICDAVTPLLPQAEAILLTGGFGRGEGGVFLQDGQAVPVNDYDIAILDSGDDQPDLKTLGRNLAKTIGIDYIDLGQYPVHFADLPISQFRYDLKYGSRVLRGDPTVLHALPQYAPADIPVQEGIQLLANRIAGIMTSPWETTVTNSFRGFKEKCYFLNQLVKTLIAVGDYHLLRWAAYDVSYLTRRDRFSILSEAEAFPKEMKERIWQAYSFKVQPNYESIADLWKYYHDVVHIVRQTLIHWADMASSADIDTTQEALRTYYRHFSERQANISADNEFFIRRLSSRLSPYIRKEIPNGLSVRYSNYCALMSLLFTLKEDFDVRQDSMQLAVDWISPVLKEPIRKDGSPALQEWNSLRTFLISLWEEACH